LRDAIANLKASAFARRMLSDAVVDHYVHFFETEQAAYDKAVTDWERKRYFERI
jgi:glutamine synthetase